MIMISVITPVYNAGRFLNKSIESVLSQPEVSEHLLIDDGSTDNSWSLIKKWSSRDKRIVALQHSDKNNHGRSATRNLGIIASNKSFIAFLDADDYYLPNRFSNDLHILENDNTIDGVYNAIGAYYYDDYIGEKNEWLNLTTLKEKILPENLFESMVPFGNKGWFSGDGLTVRKSIFKKVGLFDENLIVAEDTHLWSKMALKSKLAAGIIERPVTIRGVHGENVFNQDDLYMKERLKMSQSLFKWAYENNVELSRMELIWNRRNLYFRNVFRGKKGIIKLYFKWAIDVINYPKLFKSKQIRIFPITLAKRILHTNKKI